MTESHADTIRRAQEAWARIQAAPMFEDWVLIGRGLQIGREIAMREAGTNIPEGGAYSRAFSAWMSRNGFDENQIKKTTRSNLKSCLEHLDEVRAWLKTVGEKRLQWNHPQTIWKHFNKRNAAPKRNGSRSDLPRDLPKKEKAREPEVVSDPNLSANPDVKLAEENERVWAALMTWRPPDADIKHYKETFANIPIQKLPTPPGTYYWDPVGFSAKLSWELECEVIRLINDDDDDEFKIIAVGTGDGNEPQPVGGFIVEWGGIFEPMETLDEALEYIRAVIKNHDYPLNWRDDGFQRDRAEYESQIAELQARIRELESLEPKLANPKTFIGIPIEKLPQLPQGWKWVPMGVSSRMQAEIQCEVICVRTEEGQDYPIIAPEPVCVPEDVHLASSDYEDFIILGPYTRSEERVRVGSLPEAIQRIVGYEAVDD